MSERVDAFCEDLHVKLTGIEKKVNDFKDKIESDRAATKDAIDGEVDKANAALKKTKDDAAAARTRMKAHVAEKKLETETTIAEWKRNRELDKLERRAEDAEAYATWSVLVAAEAMDEADLATMQALAARLDVDMAVAN